MAPWIFPSLSYRSIPFDGLRVPETAVTLPYLLPCTVFPLEKANGVMTDLSTSKHHNNNAIMRSKVDHLATTSALALALEGDVPD